MNAWNQTAGVSFVETRGVGKVRISRNQAGYWSYLGTDILHIPNNRPTLNLQGFTMNTDEREYRRVVRHEAGHTLGFPHEHMREELVALIDPEKAYDFFLRTQGWSREMVDEQVLTPLSAEFDHGHSAGSGFDHVLPASGIDYEKRSADPGRQGHQRHRLRVRRAASIRRSRMRLRHRSRQRWASPTNGRHRRTWKWTRNWCSNTLAHLVEIQACQDLPPVLHVRVGDVLMFGATGGRLLEGGTTIELLGIFSTSVLSDDGRVLQSGRTADHRLVSCAPIRAGPHRVDHGGSVARNPTTAADRDCCRRLTKMIAFGSRSVLAMGRERLRQRAGAGGRQRHHRAMSQNPGRRFHPPAGRSRQ